MIRLKEGFVRIAEAYIELGKKCSTVFEAQKVLFYPRFEIYLINANIFIYILKDIPYLHEVITRTVQILIQYTVYHFLKST